MRDDVDPSDDEGVEMYRYELDTLQPLPQNALQTADQEEGVDYGCYGFMFSVRAKNVPIVITGIQICSAMGTPFDYKVHVCRGGWREARYDAARWTLCGGGTRIYVPDYAHGEYGSLPFTSDGVALAPGETRSFLIHSNNAISAVGYRLLDDAPPGGVTEEVLPRRGAAARRRRPPRARRGRGAGRRGADGGARQDAHMALLEGTPVESKHPWERPEERAPHDQRVSREDGQRGPGWWETDLDPAPRGFLGRVEYAFP